MMALDKLISTDWFSGSYGKRRDKMKRFGLILGACLLAGNAAYASFDKGLQAYQNKDFETAISIWQEEGAKGNLDAQYNLGVLYEKGAPGVQINMVSAYAWYRLAAAQGVATAQQALTRITPLMTDTQVEEGNQDAIELYGRWYRKNIGLADEQYQQLVKQREAQIAARKKAEEDAAKARAQQQRALLAQRDAAAQRAEQAKEQSRQAAILAAQREAEAAKRQAAADAAARAEDERLANEQAERDRQLKLAAAKLRLQQLKAKQQGGGSQSAPSVASTTLAPVTSTTTAATTATATPTPSVATPSVTPTAQPKAAATPEVQVAKPVTPQQQVQQPAVQPSQPQVTAKAEPKTATAAENASAGKAVASAPQSQTAMPTNRTPLISNGMDADVVKEILAASKSVPLDTVAAKAEIAKARTEISALKWSLISAARGKVGAKGMNPILQKSMTAAQIAEANRQAAEWIVKRQSRN